MGTGHIVIMRDPDEGWINFGVERAMIQDEKTLNLYVSPGKHNSIIRNKHYSRGQTCPVVMDFGPDPFLFISGATDVPWGISEFDWAGYMRNEAVEVVKGKITGIPFPARSEIVIEGECLLPEEDSRIEGPLREWTGYYAGGKRAEPVVRVKAIYHRNNPILHGVIHPEPPITTFFMPVRNSAIIWNNLEGAGLTGIKGVWEHDAGRADVNGYLN